MQALVAKVLAAWRDAERVAADPILTSAQRRLAREAAARLRDVYAELTQTPPTPSPPDQRPAAKP